MCLANSLAYHMPTSFSLPILTWRPGKCVAPPITPSAAKTSEQLIEFNSLTWQPILCQSWKIFCTQRSSPENAMPIILASQIVHLKGRMVQRQGVAGWHPGLSSGPP